MPAASKRSRTARSGRWWMGMTKPPGRRTAGPSSKSPAVVTISAARRNRAALLLSLGLTAGCALKGDVRKVELQVQALQADLAKSDTARRAEKDSILSAVRILQQAL